MRSPKLYFITTMARKPPLRPCAPFFWSWTLSPGSRTLGLECSGVQDGPDYREPCAVPDSVSHGGGQASRLWERGGPCLGQGFYRTGLITHSKAQRLAVPVSEPK